MSAIRVGIINDFDAPQANMLAIAVGEAGDANVDYLDRNRRRLRGRGYSLRHWTDVASFGVEIVLAAGNILVAEQVRPSLATYPDGAPRRWQAVSSAGIHVCPTCWPALTRFLQAGMSLAEVG